MPAAARSEIQLLRGLWRDNLDEKRATIWMRIWCRGGGDDRGIVCRAQ
jgi:hypothetical protein